MRYQSPTFITAFLTVQGDMHYQTPQNPASMIVNEAQVTFPSESCTLASVDTRQTLANKTILADGETQSVGADSLLYNSDQGTDYVKLTHIQEQPRNGCVLTIDSGESAKEIGLFAKWTPPIAAGIATLDAPISIDPTPPTGNQVLLATSETSAQWSSNLPPASSLKVSPKGSVDVTSPGTLPTLGSALTIASMTPPITASWLPIMTPFSNIIGPVETQTTPENSDAVLSFDYIPSTFIVTMLFFITAQTQDLSQGASFCFVSSCKPDGTLVGTPQSIFSISDDSFGIWVQDITVENQTFLVKMSGPISTTVLWSVTSAQT